MGAVWSRESGAGNDRTPFGAGRVAGWAEVGERLRTFASEGAFDRAVHFSLRPDPSGGGLLQVTMLDLHGHGLASEGRSIGGDDPLRALFEEAAAFDWQEGDPLGDLIAGLGIAREDARRGWAMPIEGPGRARGLFAVTTGRNDPVEGRTHRRLLEHWLSVFGWELHGSVVALLEDAETEATDRQLAPREIAVLAAAADGHSTRQTAIHLGLSKETVEGCLRDAVRRLGCLNETHAVAVAVRRGMI